MPKRTINYLLHPLRYPEWGELVCAMLGGLQFVWALAIFGQFDNRPGLATTVYLSPETWVFCGLVLAVGHVAALRFGGAPWGYRARLAASASSLAFWFHFLLSIAVNELMRGNPIPVSLLPGVAAPLLSGAVLWRLWRRY